MEEDVFSCPACESTLHFWFVKKTESGSFSIRRCLRCKSAFVMPRPPASQIANLYRDLESSSDDTITEKYDELLKNEKRHPTLSTDGKRIAERIASLTLGKKLLDVGSGFGFHSQSLISAGFNVEALEPDAKARGIFRRINGFDPFNGYFDDQFVKSHEAIYDIVLLTQVLEHMEDPNQIAGFINRLLAPDGIAAIALPGFRSWFSILSGRKDMFISPPHHLNFFTKLGLKTLMERYGFKLVYCETVTWFEPERVISRFKFRFLGLLAVSLLTIFSNIADRFNKGNTLEAYFQKIK
jgi:SAM-dependent methyltransferase